MALPITLQDFEGPLDLLLYLIKKEEVDIYDIPISQITKQYLSYLDEMKNEQLNIAGEFFVMAAMLIQIKTQMLLPRPEVDGLDEIEDPRERLVLQLLEYQKFKEFAGKLKDTFEDRKNIFFRGYYPEHHEILNEQEIELNINKFYQILLEVSNQIMAKNAYEVETDPVSIEEKINFILSVIAQNEHYRFSHLIDFNLRTDIVITFMALLELSKLQKLRLIQNENFQEIWLERIRIDGKS